MFQTCFRTPISWLVLGPQIFVGLPLVLQAYPVNYSWLIHPPKSLSIFSSSAQILLVYFVFDRLHPNFGRFNRCFTAYQNSAGLLVFDSLSRLFSLLFFGSRPISKIHEIHIYFFCIISHNASPCEYIYWTIFLAILLYVLVSKSQAEIPTTPNFYCPDSFVGSSTCYEDTILVDNAPSPADDPSKSNASVEESPKWLRISYPDFPSNHLPIKTLLSHHILTYTSLDAPFVDKKENL